MPTPSAKDFYLTLIDVIASGEPKRVGSTTLSPDREYPRSDTGLWALALDLAAAERVGRAA